MMDISMKYVLSKIKLPAKAFCKIVNNKFCYLVKVCLYAAVVTCTANTKMLALSNDLTNSIELEVRQQQSIGTENSGLDDFYNPDQTQSIHLRVKASDRQKMFDALPERIYVPASFEWRDTLIDQVAIRFKGNSSSRPNQLHKRSFLIKFNKYNEAQRFLGYAVSRWTMESSLVAFLVNRLLLKFSVRKVLRSIVAITPSSILTTSTRVFMLMLNDWINRSWSTTGLVLTGLCGKLI